MPRGLAASGRALATLAFLLSPGTGAAGQALILFDSFRPTVGEGAAALGDILAARGFSVDLREPLPGDDIGDLAGFDCVWDLRIDDPPAPAQETRFRDYALAGGTLYLAGEHGVFVPRNQWIAGFLASLGGGAVAVSLAPPASPVPIDAVEQIDPDHPASFRCLAVTEVVYDGIANGDFLDVGAGQALTSDGVEVGAAVWDAGALGLAPEATVLSALDSNYLSPGTTGTLDVRVDRFTPSENRAFVHNLVTHLCLVNSPHRPGGPNGPRAPRSPRSPHSACSPASPRSPSSTP